MKVNERQWSDDFGMAARLNSVVPAIKWHRQQTAFIHRHGFRQPYREEVRFLCTKEIGEERKRLLKVIDGATFPPLKSWPREMVLIFWKKPPGDWETFKLVLFLLGNGCCPNLIRRWMVLSQYWASSTVMVEKQCQQVDFILNNEDQKRDSWFYFDIHNQSLLHLNGQRQV